MKADFTRLMAMSFVKSPNEKRIEHQIIAPTLSILAIILFKLHNGKNSFG